jgi:hypothetical protein
MNTPGTFDPYQYDPTELRSVFDTHDKAVALANQARDAGIRKPVAAFHAGFLAASTALEAESFAHGSNPPIPYGPAVEHYDTLRALAWAQHAAEIAGAQVTA